MREIIHSFLSERIDNNDNIDLHECMYVCFCLYREYSSMSLPKNALLFIIYTLSHIFLEAKKQNFNRYRF